MTMPTSAGMCSPASSSSRPTARLAAALQRTSAVQGMLDLIQSERLVDPSASTSPSAAGTDLQCALQVLCELARRDAKLLALCRGHPAVEDLDGWRRGEPWRG